jgi:hypothetical protein
MREFEDPPGHVHPGGDGNLQNDRGTASAPPGGRDEAVDLTITERGESHE